MRFASIVLIVFFLFFVLEKIFDNEKEFPYLIKEYDSKENGFKYHVKLFRINYDKFSEEINWS